MTTEHGTIRVNKYKVCIILNALFNWCYSFRIVCSIKWMILNIICLERSESLLKCLSRMVDVCPELCRYRDNFWREIIFDEGICSPHSSGSIRRSMWEHLYAIQPRSTGYVGYIAPLGQIGSVLLLIVYLTCWQLEGDMVIITPGSPSFPRSRRSQVPVYTTRQNTTGQDWMFSLPPQEMCALITWLLRLRVLCCKLFT